MEFLLTGQVWTSQVLTGGFFSYEIVGGGGGGYSWNGVPIFGSSVPTFSGPAGLLHLCIIDQSLDLI